MTVEATDAVATWIAAGDDVADLVGEDVFGGEFPGDMAALHPSPAVVVQDAGGTGFATMPLDKPRYDVKSYGRTPQEAKLVAAAVHARLKALRRQVVGNVFLHSATPSGGFISAREPVVRWPLTLRSYVVLHDEREVV